MFLIEEFDESCIDKIFRLEVWEWELRFLLILEVCNLNNLRLLLLIKLRVNFFLDNDFLMN